MTPFAGICSNGKFTSNLGYASLKHPERDCRIKTLGAKKYFLAFCPSKGHIINHRGLLDTGFSNLIIAWASILWTRPYKRCLLSNYNIMATAEAKATTRHLFRALLRAASYLPDEFAQTYIHNHIIHRFRAASKITPARLQDARGALNTLQRANNGEIKPLTKVLHLAYGRTGRRRRELIVALLRADAKPLQDPDLPTAVSVSDGGGSDGSSQSPRPVFDMFVRSQSLNHPPDTSRVKIRHLEPQIPEESIWGKPVALRRQRSLRHRWWSETLNKLLPPLPEPEWNRLRDLATGVIPFEGPPIRRRQLVLSDGKPAESLNISCFKTPIRHAVRHSQDNRQKTMNRHKINARFMRRMWANVWNLTPKMCYDGEIMEWTVTWGGGRSAASNGRAGSAGKADLELFEGIELLGTGPGRADYRTRKSAAQSCMQLTVPVIKPADSVET